MPRKPAPDTESFVLRVDAETMAALKKWAADEFRSVNGQLQWLIAEALRHGPRMFRPAAVICRRPPIS